MEHLDFSPGIPNWQRQISFFSFFFLWMTYCLALHALLGRTMSCFPPRHYTQSCTCLLPHLFRLFCTRWAPGEPQLRKLLRALCWLQDCCPENTFPWPQWKLWYMFVPASFKTFKIMWILNVWSLSSLDCWLPKSLRIIAPEIVSRSVVKCLEGNAAGAEQDDCCMQGKEHRNSAAG